MFVKAEEAKVEDLATVAAMMGQHTVTANDVKQACLRNCCETTMPIRYAAHYIPDFDVENCVRELIDALLCQPYRGRMLR